MASIFGGSAAKPTQSLFGSASSTNPLQGQNLFGSSPASNPAQGQSMFGATTSNISQAQSLFGGPSTNPAQGKSLFGSGTTPSLFAGGAINAANTSQLQSFGGTQQQEQQQQIAGNTLQGVMQDVSRITAAVSGPEIYLDDRDRVLSTLNQLLAACGVGSGYYKQGVPPYNFTQENPFHCLKGAIIFFRGIGYNRLSKHKNSEGFVSLLLKVQPSQIETPQQKQKVIDAVNNLLRGTSAPSSFLGASSAKPVKNVQVEIKSIIPAGDSMTEVIIYASEPGRGIWKALELYSELSGQQDKANWIKQNLNCEKIVPRVEVSKDELENYLKRPPLGFEEIWPEAVRRNPDPTSLVPYPIQGFKQLIQRQKMQKSVIAAQNSALKNFLDRLEQVEYEWSSAHNSYTKCRQTQKQISHRLLRVLATQTLIQRYGLMVDEKEEQLQCRLESINAQLNSPDMIKSRISRIYELLRKDGDMIKEKIREQKSCKNFSATNMHEIKRCLGSRQALLENLVESVKSSIKVLRIIKNSREG